MTWVPHQSRTSTHVTAFIYLWAVCLEFTDIKSVIQLEAEQLPLSRAEALWSQSYLLCLEYLPLTWPLPSHPGVGQLLLVHGETNTRRHDQGHGTRFAHDGQWMMLSSQLAHLSSCFISCGIDSNAAVNKEGWKDPSSRQASYWKVGSINENKSKSKLYKDFDCFLLKGIVFLWLQWICHICQTLSKLYCQKVLCNSILFFHKSLHCSCRDFQQQGRIAFSTNQHSNSSNNL